MLERPLSSNLPREILPKNSWRKLSVLVSLTLLILILSNLFTIRYLDKYSSNYGYWTIHQKWNLLKRLDSPVDWLILGDSSCSQGVMPSIFYAQLAQTAINLCTTGDMGSLGDLWMLEEYIQRFGAPNNILIVHTYDIWYREFDPARLGQIPRPWKFWEDHTFGNELTTERDIREGIFFENYLPLYSHNKILGIIIRSVLSGNLKPFHSKWAMSEDGFVSAYEPKPDIVQAGAKQQIEFTSLNTFQVSFLNEQALRKIIDLADDYEINMYLANSPVYEGLNSDANYQAYFQSVHAFLKDVTDQSSNAHNISAVKIFPADQMQNPDHLIVSGAEEYTRWLIDEITNWEEIYLITTN